MNIFRARKSKSSAMADAIAAVDATANECLPYVPMYFRDSHPFPGRAAVLAIADVMKHELLRDDRRTEIVSRVGLRMLIAYGRVSTERVPESLAVDIGKARKALVMVGAFSEERSFSSATLLLMEYAHRGCARPQCSGGHCQPDRSALV